MSAGTSEPAASPSGVASKVARKRRRESPGKVAIVSDKNRRKYGPIATMDALICLFGDCQEILLSWAKNASVLDVPHEQYPWPDHAIGCLRKNAVYSIQKEEIAIIEQIKRECPTDECLVPTAVLKANDLVGFRDILKSKCSHLC